jgi:hypothetical protein
MNIGKGTSSQSSNPSLSENQIKDMVKNLVTQYKSKDDGDSKKKISIQDHDKIIKALR